MKTSVFFMTTFLLIGLLPSVMAEIHLECPPDIHLGCIKSETDIPKPDPESVKSKSDCREVKVVHVGDRIFEEGCTTRIERHYRATNACRETASCRQVISFIMDTKPPVFENCDEKTYLGCNPDLKRVLPDPKADKIIASDNCGIKDVTFVKEEKNDDGCAYYSTRIYRAYDYCGNSSLCKKTYVWHQDKTRPLIIRGPEDLDLGCNPESLDFPKHNLSQFKIEDECQLEELYVKEVRWDTADCSKMRCTLYGIKDRCGNETEYKHCVKWCIDLESPNISCPKPLDLGCNPRSIPNADVGKIKAWDNCDGALEIYVSASSISEEDCLYTLHRTYTAVDQAGNTNSCDEIFLWHESEGIEFVECPEDFDLGTLEEMPPYFPNFTISLQTEGCGMDTSWYEDGEVITEGCSSKVVRTWYVEDICGFKDTCRQTFSWILDKDDIECPSDKHYPCNRSWESMVPQYAPGQIIKFDECTGHKLVFYQYALDVLIDIENCKGWFAIYYHLIEGEDTTLCAQSITWDLSFGDCPCIDDITTRPPEDICLDDRYISCGESSLTPNPYHSYELGDFVRANDRGDRLYVADKSIQIYDCIEIYYIHYVIHDAAGNVIRCTQKITVEIESEQCPCIDDFAIEPHGLCPDDIHHPCGTNQDVIFPHQPGDWIESDGAGANLYFDSYGVDIILFDCKFHVTAIYNIVLADGTITKCQQKITWDADADGCPCIDDFATIPASDPCPEDQHFACTVPWDQMFPYAPGDIVVLYYTGGAIIFDQYFHTLLGGCVGLSYADYIIVDENNDTTRCRQEITYDRNWDDCPCIDDFTTLPKSDPCPENQHFSCTVPWDQMFPWDEGEIIVAYYEGGALIFDRYIHTYLGGCVGLSYADYLIIDAEGDTTTCRQEITYDRDWDDCPCIDGFTTADPKYKEPDRGAMIKSDADVAGIDSPMAPIHHGLAKDAPGTFNIFPNPVQVDFIIDFGSVVDPIHEIQISDLNGRIWYSNAEVSVVNASVIIDSHTWPVGVYSVTLVTEHEIMTRRLIKL